MLWRSIVLSALFLSVAFAHSTYHVDEQEPIAQERLEELERKWGIDVSAAQYYQTQLLIQY